MGAVGLGSAPILNRKKNYRQKNDRQEEERDQGEREKQRVNLVRHRRRLRREKTKLVHDKA
jgi:hypothetical protein